MTLTMRDVAKYGPNCFGNAQMETANHVQAEGITSTPVYTAVTVTASPTALPASPLRNRTHLEVHNTSETPFRMCTSDGEEEGVILMPGDASEYWINDELVVGMYGKTAGALYSATVVCVEYY